MKKLSLHIGDLNGAQELSASQGVAISVRILQQLEVVFLPRSRNPGLLFP